MDIRMVLVTLAVCLSTGCGDDDDGGDVGGTGSSSTASGATAGTSSSAGTTASTSTSTSVGTGSTAGPGTGSSTGGMNPGDRCGAITREGCCDVDDNVWMCIDRGQGPELEMVACSDVPCGWGPTGEPDPLERYICGGVGEDPSGTFPRACPGD